MFRAHTANLIQTRIRAKICGEPLGKTLCATVTKMTERSSTPRRTHLTPTKQAEQVVTFYPRRGSPKKFKKYILYHAELIPIILYDIMLNIILRCPYGGNEFTTVTQESTYIK